MKKLAKIVWNCEICFLLRFFSLFMLCELALRKTWKILSFNFSKAITLITFSNFTNFESEFYYLLKVLMDKWLMDKKLESCEVSFYLNNLEVYFSAINNFRKMLIKSITTIFFQEMISPFHVNNPNDFLFNSRMKSPVAEKYSSIV